MEIELDWTRVKPSSTHPGCLEWQGSRNNKNYGTFRARMAHRVAYEEKIGAIPEGKVLHHKCFNPPCVNVAHLEITTQQLNLHVGDTIIAKQIAQTACHNGHEFNEANTHVDKLNKKHCRVCDRERKTKAYAQKKKR